MFRVIWTQCVYRLACARGSGTDAQAFAVLRAFDVWSARGFRGRRFVWLLMWAVHFTLWPVRRVYRSN